MVNAGAFLALRQAFHDHRDACPQCKATPFDLCPVGERELFAADGPELPKLRIWSRTNPPDTIEAFESLKEWEADELRAAGLVRWDHAGPDGFALWLFPASWFYAVPSGLEVTSIMGNSGAWSAAEASTDQRAGCIAYGFRIRHRVTR